jgi:hypothetical protein
MVICTMLNISTFFRDMFSLPDAGTGASSANDSVSLEETANVIERMLHAIYSSRCDDLVPVTRDVGLLNAIVEAHDKFDIETHRFEAKAALDSALRQNPWEGFGYASHNNDLRLGRIAIQLMRLEETDDSDIWDLLSDVKPTWQIALGRLILPRMKNESFSFYEGDEEEQLSGIEWYRMCSTGFRLNMREVAKRFNPK